MLFPHLKTHLVSVFRADPLTSHAAARALLGLLCCLIIVCCVGVSPTAYADISWFPSDFFIHAEPVDGEDGYYKLKVTWKAVEEADYIELYRKGGTIDSPILNSSGQNTGWDLSHVVQLGPNEHEYVDVVLGSYRYAIIAHKDNNDTPTIESVHSNVAVPNFPPDPASVDSLQISQYGTDRVRVQWTQSENTVYSRAEISRNGTVVDSEENSPSQSVLFTGLTPNTSYDVTVCVRAPEQPADEESCRSVPVKTLPLIPLAARLVSVDQDDPNPHQRTISFTYENRQENAVRGISVRLIKDDAILADVDLRPDTFGTKTYEHTFMDLEPFESYEAWVVPYNETGVGTAAGIGFTSPAEVNLSLLPLSANSAILLLRNTVIGEYSVKIRTGNTWSQICSIRPGETEVTPLILDGLDESREFKVSWKLAYLRSESSPVEVSPLSAGTPELVSIDYTPTYMSGEGGVSSGGLTRSAPTIIQGMLNSVAFRTTAAGHSQYVLQRRMGSDWITVATRSGFFAKNAYYTISERTTEAHIFYRVCKNDRFVFAGIRTTSSHCGSENWASHDIQRVQCVRARLHL